MLESGNSALDAAVEAARIMEDDGRFNAGWGSALRMDGSTVEMDASVMDSAGNIGAVIAVRNVKNPVLLAKALINTPHVALAGCGAENFARMKGLAPLAGISESSRKRYETMLRLIRERKTEDLNPLWQGFDLRGLWNFDIAYEEVFSCDTVGAVALDKRGGFACASSTGGASPMMMGRVGDTPMPGCGFWAGPSGAFAATGIGEGIIKKMLSRSVFDMVEEGTGIEEACEAGIRLFSKEIMAGVIGISKTGWAASSNRKMARFALVKKA
jgi:L-asparaginase/beta-aspartyl-peptidase (threonine type)